jgi:outer membrane lipopolysaccharide assembly protein LptE/RlpB
MNKRKVFTLVILLAVALIIGCGYRFSPGGEYIDKSIQTVFVDNIGNRTSQANLENTFRNAFIDQFRKSSRFKLAESRDSADAILKGTITSLSSSHLSYSRADVAREDRATVTMELTFEERSSRKVIWSNTAFSWYADYLINQADTLATEINRKNALDKLASDTADRAYRLIMSGF